MFKNFIEKFKNISNKIYSWLRIDGLLHLLTCYSIHLSLVPVDINLARSIVVLAATGKECYDYFIQKDNTLKEVAHDSLCDIIGITLAELTVFSWKLFNLI